MRVNIHITNAERKKEDTSTKVSTEAQKSYIAKTEALGLEVKPIADGPEVYKGIRNA